MARALVLLIFASVLMAACGPLGDDEESTGPAATAIANATAVPSPRAGATPRDAAPIATPRVTTSSPEASPAPGRATPRPGTSTPGAAGSGSTPRISTPSTDAGPDTTADGTPRPPVAEDCEPPAELPEVIGEAERQTTEVVNVRVGPGLDCDLVTQIEAGTAVTVQSGPVEASDLLWILVTVDGEQGWVAEEYVPSEEVSRGAGPW